MDQGKIVQCIGAVVDVEFSREALPKVYDALTMEGSELTLEVQQQLGDGIVRTIALGSSDGWRRGMMVSNTKCVVTRSGHMWERLQTLNCHNSYRLRPLSVKLG